jgi:predicted patatin/cPLA2 family phospholipase
MLVNNTVPSVDVRSEQEVRAYFEQLEREYPQLIEAMRVMNISYQQYLAALRALQQQSSFSTSSTQLTL